MTEIDVQTIFLRQHIEELQALKKNPDMVSIPYVGCLSCYRSFFSLFKKCTWCKCPRPNW